MKPLCLQTRISAMAATLLACLLTASVRSSEFDQAGAIALTRPDTVAFPELYVRSDTCNVFIIKDGAAALLIDLGDGSVLDSLADIGVERVEWVLFTHHHREQCQGAARLLNGGAKLAGPEAERTLFENPANYRKMKARLEDAYTVYGSSYVRPPVRPIALDQGFKNGDIFYWHGYQFHCLQTPGNSPGGMTYRVRINGRWLAFGGDVMLDGARMHTWFDTEWDYGFAAGIHALQKSVAVLQTCKIDLLLPSHGPAVRNPKNQLAAYAEKLRHLEKLYVRGYGVEAASNAYQDKVSKPTRIKDVFQVLPHLFKFKRENFWPNFGLILSDSGQGLVVDCGLLDEKFLDASIEGLRQHYGLKAIDAVIISHMHGDHFLQVPHLREKWGAKIWALDSMVDKMEHPERFDLAAAIQAYGGGMDGVTVDRAFKSGESFSWEGYRFTVDWMPGQTEFALCMHGIIDGRKVAFTGDNIFGDPDDLTQTGHEAMVAHNGAILEEGYILGAEYLKRLKPDLLVGGHSFVMDHPGQFIERYRKWSYEMRRAFQALSSKGDYRYGFDPFWVRVEPYRLALPAGGGGDAVLLARNFSNSPRPYRISFDCPGGLIAQPASIEVVVAPRSTARMPFRILAGPNAAPGLHIIGLDMTINGERYGDWFDFILSLEASPKKGEERP